MTLDLCLLPATSDALHACIMGSWTSAFAFPQPCFCAFSEAFSLTPLGQIDSENPKVIPLPRKVAEELLLAAALAPLACADVAAPFSAELFATDASERKGAICSAPFLSTSVPPFGKPQIAKEAMRGLLARLRSCELILCGRISAQLPRALLLSTGP